MTTRHTQPFAVFSGTEFKRWIRAYSREAALRYAREEYDYADATSRGLAFQIGGKDAFGFYAWNAPEV